MASIYILKFYMAAVSLRTAFYTTTQDNIMSVSMTEWTKICDTEYHLDTYINDSEIQAEIAKSQLGVADINGLGDLRWFTAAGSLRGLIGSSAKVSKTVSEATSPVEIGQMFLSPAKEALRHVEEVFPSTGWRAGSADDVLKMGIIPIQSKLSDPTPNPRRASKFNWTSTCKFAGKCSKTCLLQTGNIVMDTSLRSRYAKTWFWLTEPKTFLRLLLAEIRKLSAKAHKVGKKLYLRLNGLSDIRWERFIHMDRLVANIEGLGGFYDYTKWPSKLRVTANFPSSYRLVYSIDEKRLASREQAAYRALGHGAAVVWPHYGGKRTPPAKLQKLIADGKAVNGDLHDGRFADAPGSLVLLSSKGNLKPKTHLGVRKTGWQSDLIAPIANIMSIA